VSKSGLNDNARYGWSAAHLKSTLVPDTISYAGGIDATEQHYTGKERDAESGNNYFGARYYASSMGRFLSPDWSAKVEPVPYAKLDDPQSLNLYSYVLNDPLGGVDPDGHATGDMGTEVAAFAQTVVGIVGQSGAAAMGIALGNALVAANTNLLNSQQNGTARQRGFDKQRAATYMNTTGAKGYNKYGSYCARACHAGLRAGGIDIGDRPKSGLAKDNGPFLMRHGFKPVASGIAAKGLPSGYTPEAGDTAVFQGGPHHTSGHMEMYDGKQWDSDTHQPRFAPDRNYPGTYVIYRYPDQ
jgi:RHS repeat-associated protein